jgi:hypothetical protein
MRWYKIAKKRKWRQVDSSFIRAVSYASSTHTLSIRLKGNAIYTFKDVTKDTYKDFLKSQSKGRFFNKHLKDNYNWVRE